jgi:hypothetical protein
MIAHNGAWEAEGTDGAPGELRIRLTEAELARDIHAVLAASPRGERESTRTCDLLRVNLAGRACGAVSADDCGCQRSSLICRASPAFAPLLTFPANWRAAAEDRSFSPILNRVTSQPRSRILYTAMRYTLSWWTMRPRSRFCNCQSQGRSDRVDWGGWY